MAIQIEAIDLEQVERKLGVFKEKAPKVLKLAVNDTAKKARSRLAKEAQKNYAVQVQGFNRVMNIRLASNANPVAVISSKGKTIPAYKFKKRGNTMGGERYYNPTTHHTQTGKGGRAAMVQQLKQSSPKSIQKGKLKAFVATMPKSGHTGIFQRREGYARGEKREIQEIMGSSIPVMIGSEKHVYGIVKPYIQSDLKEAVNRHVSRAIRGEI